MRGAPGPALAATYLSLLVLLPIAAILSKAFDGGVGAFWREVTQTETLAALKLTIITSLIVVAVNSVAGTAIAWLLVRDRRFALNKVIGALVDLPFALPTVVAGVVLLSIYGAGSPVGIDVAYTRAAIVVALAFVTLPFSVRSVQPVLAALDTDTEEAAASLGATPWTTFRRVTLPSLLPAILTGAGLGFARAVGEFGSVTLFSGNLPFKTEVAAVRIFGLIDSDSLPAAAAVSLALFIVSLVVLTLFSLLRRRLLPVEADS
ncbi:MAG: sulfate transporter, inner rane subunit CysT [Acidimicrobiaceae bacterium]|nr:sulfate transporter, inner rane subunit CysT [Acidimicrobiaceae bacterium]